MASKVKQIKDWLDAQFEAAHATVMEAGQGNNSLTSETIIQNVVKMSFVTEAKAFIEGLGEEE
jgi:hypothetical protein